MTRPLTDRFWEKVKKGEPEACWPWTGHRGRNGYGRIAVRSVGPVSASRASWFLAHGRWPSGVVCHACDNPPCVNPAHLWEGTQRDNIRDCVAKGRGIANRRKQQTHCKRGHEFTPENTHLDSKGRSCRECRKSASRAHRIGVKARLA